MPKKNHKKKAPTIYHWLVVGVFALMIIFSILSMLYTQKETIFMAFSEGIVVGWPLENVQLSQTQVFSVDVPFRSPSDVQVFWEVEGGIHGGEMVYSEDGSFKSEVDTTSWDWKKDNTYEVLFSLTDTRDVLLSTTSVTVYVGEVRETTELATDTEATFAQNAAAAYARLKKKSTPPPVTTPAQQSTHFKVEWQKGASKDNQKFVYTIAGYKLDDISAYWQAEGGHKNLIYTTGAQSQISTSINLFGWRWKNKGPYTITFAIADKKTSTLLASEQFDMYWKGEPGKSDIELTSKGAVIAHTDKAKAVIQTTTPVTQSTTPTTTVTKAPPAKPVITPQNLDTRTALTQSLFASSKPAVQESLSKETDQQGKTALTYILSQPNAVWLNGDSYENSAYVAGILKSARDKNQIPTFVLYNIPNRDCGSYSSGGTDTIENYTRWIDRIAKDLANEKAIVIVEPDALAQLNCIPEADRPGRLTMIQYAVEKIVATSNATMVYIDAGHPFWVNGDEMAKRLESAGIAKARGFALNVSNYIATNDNITYGNYVSSLLGGKKYVIDTSRNGKGPSPSREWCNPSGRSLGATPTTIRNSGDPLDALLWIKFPGESDGECNGGPRPGMFWAQYAIDLYKNR
jgi:endoglucanase